MKPDTHSGNRGLDLEEPLLFDSLPVGARPKR